MTDRELLEAAAKAAGVVGEWAEMRRVLTDCGRETFTGIMIDKENVWNPLTDDGDALRLAGALRLNVCVEDHYTWTDVGCNEDHGSDPFAATRRAIVRAAAAMAGQETP